MKNTNKKTILTLLIVIAMMVISVSTAFAASAAVSVSGGTVNKGNTITVTVKYSGATYGSVAADINYDKSYLQFQSCSTTSGGGNGKITVSMVGANESSLSCTVKFKALKAGSTSVRVDTVEAYNMDGEELSAASKSSSITIKDPSTAASSNANLASLKVSAGTLSPAFSANTTSYKVNVANSVTSCTLSVKTADSKATYKISGSSSLAVGNNVRKVTVTAENGATKTYTITIVRAAKSSSDGGNNSQGGGDKEENKRPDQFEVKVGDKTYLICENYDSKDIPQGFTMTVADFGEYEIPVFKDAELKYTVALLEDKATGDDNWFFYNEESDAFEQKTSLSAKEIIEYEEMILKGTDSPSGDNKTDATEKMLFIALGGTLLLLFVAVLLLQFKIMKSRKRDLE
ncbi:MAG: cadherin-like beta sandwich domain-containing protein [Firmicutes bacterium]|nr:cadherin-like beta sandwich domain-containing protein [Bacillota bacterium]